ncbi:MAG: bifunctional riboflavin kinase/FAD synthetase [Fidelibacterota bacterium]
MVVYRRIEDVLPVAHTVLTIGSYDGLHRGHQEVIRRVVEKGRQGNRKSVVVTFDPHPKQVLGPPEDRFDLLMDIDRKLRFLELMGVDIALVIPFTHDFSRTSAGDFLDTVIVPNFQPDEIIIGHDHRFGHNREGDSRLLRRYQEMGRFRVEVVSGITGDNRVISSRYIRDLIRQGRVQEASHELGWVYGFDATVVRGAGRGRELSFPTANFIPKNPHQLIPKTGVYCARGTVREKGYEGMANIGTRPTFNGNGLVMEIHFFDGNMEDLYGETIQVEFVERIRDEKKFRSARELVRQLEKDRETCLGLS